MRVCPEQNSMSGARILIAAPGEPADGSHSRGSDIAAVPVSNFPQARSLPVGRRLRCRGTMSHETGASHLPVVAVAGSAFKVTVADSAVAAPAV
jgi:hypothetical protein